jgi:hypothetical protein
VAYIGIIFQIINPMKRTFTQCWYSFILVLIFSASQPANSQSNAPFDVEVTSGYNWVFQILPLSGNRVAVIVGNDGNTITYLRIYNSSGTQTADINITSQFNWPHTTHGATDIHAITMNNGNIFIAYNANSNSTGIQTYNARYLIINETGVQQAAGQLNTIDAGTSYTWRMYLAKLSDGKIVVTWNRSASDNITFRLFNADGTAFGNDVPFTGPGTSSSSLVNSYGYGLAAGKNGNFMFSVNYWNGGLRGFVFNNNGVNAAYGGAVSFAIDPSLVNDYGNYGLAALPNGNFVGCWYLSGTNYIKILGPDGSMVVDKTSIAGGYYTGLISSNTSGAEGFILAENRMQDQYDMSNPYADLWINQYNQDGVLQNSAASADGSLIQPSFTVAAGPTGGYFYIYSFYKSFIVEDGMYSTTSDTDIKGRTVGFSMTTLPVSLISFEATLLSNRKALLTWTTSSEINSNHFEIERSTDGRNFTAIGNIEANNTGNAISNYSFTDAAPISKNTFYRLKQVDFDGKSKYLGIRLIRAGSANILVGAYPNPVQGTSITLLAGDQSLPVVYRISDVQGRVIKTGIMQQSQEEINIGDIDKGIYFLQIGTQVIKIKK